MVFCKNNIIKILTIFGFVVFISPLSAYASDLNSNSIDDSTEPEVIVSSNKTLPAGEYNFQNLILTNNATLTLQGDPGLSGSPLAFKGVKINAENITVNSGSRMSADGQGYTTGPGYTNYDKGASYGGVGGGNTEASVYGGSFTPKELGSGSGSYKGGGAIWLNVTGTLSNNGSISSDGAGQRSSGGSIYVTTNILEGSGTFTANGANTSYPYQYAGGGGRIAVYYNTSTYTGAVQVRAGVYCIYGCNPAGGAGTAIFVDTTTNNVYPKEHFRFQTNDSPFSFADINLNNSKVEVESDTIITADNISVQNNSQLHINNSTINAGTLSLSQISAITLSGAPTITIPIVNIDNSTLILSGEEVLTTDTLNLTNQGTVTVAEQKILKLDISNINMSNTAKITSDIKGYCYNNGPGKAPNYNPLDPYSYYAGASYGGIGYRNTLQSIYGSETEPVDFGSGSNAGAYNPCGGGAIRIITENLSNNGIISSNGGTGSSGGSVYITSKNFSGGGKIEAKGGTYYTPGVVTFFPGAGGRIAVYYETSTFTGTTDVKPGILCSNGCTYTYSQPGTVVMEEVVPAGCQVNCFSNVLFLPGIQASRLYITRENGTEDQLWEPNGNADVEDLYLNPDGTSANPDIYTKDIIDRTNIGFNLFDQNIYKGFGDRMNELVAEGKINEWQSFAYDWRQAVDDVAENGTKYETEIKKLEDVLTSLSQNSKNDGKVTLVAHSNGGLLAKAFLKSLQDKKIAGTSDLIDKVDVLVLVAVPQIGSADAVNVLLHGMDKLGGFLINKQSSRLLGQNMLGAYGLLPSREYINRISASPITFKDSLIPSGIMDSYINNYGNVIDSYEEYKNFLFGAEGRTNPAPLDTLVPDILSSLLFQKSENLHNSLDSWTPPSAMRVIEVAGWGIDTLASVEYYPKRYCLSLNDCEYILDHKPVFTIDGDKTVVDVSAHFVSFDANAENFWLDLQAFNKLNKVNINHGNIFETPSILDFISNLIQNGSETQPYISTTKPTATSNRLRINIQSPVSLDAYDVYGNHTGKVCPEGSDFCFVEENIPNSSYWEIGEGKYINIPEDNFDKILLQGTGIGTFTYESEKVLPDGTSTVSSFIDIPVTIETKAEITLDSNQNPELKLDITGDGDYEFTILAGEEFDPVLYLQIMKETVDGLDISNSKKNALNKRVDNIIKAIEKGKIAKAGLKAEKFKISLEKTIDKTDPKKPKHKKLTDADAQILVDMLEKLLDNIQHND